MTRINISVEFYDDKNEELFKKYKEYDSILEIVKKGVYINKSELLTYMLFKEKKNRRGFATYNQLKRKIYDRYKRFKDYLNINNSITARYIGQEMDNDITERVGISIGLNVVNEIYGLHEADWEKIPIKPQKDFDFEIASNGSKYIQVECKGNVSDNNKSKNDSIYEHKKSIEDKKDVLKEINAINNKNSCLYGTIAALDNKNNSIAKCLLVEPPGFSVDMDPMEYKLLARMYFYWNELCGISNKYHFLTLLINRINAIESIKNYKLLNNVKLLNRNGEYFEINDASFAYRSVLEDNKAIGSVYPFDDRGMYFIGYDKSIFDMLVSQDYDEIVQYKYSSGIENKLVTCRINKSNLKEFHIPSDIIKKGKEIGYYVDRYNYLEFKIEGTLNCTKSGRVYGILDFGNIK